MKLRAHFVRLPVVFSTHNAPKTNSILQTSVNIWSAQLCEYHQFSIRHFQFFSKFGRLFPPRNRGFSVKLVNFEVFCFKSGKCMFFQGFHKSRKLRPRVPANHFWIFSVVLRTSELIWSWESPTFMTPPSSLRAATTCLQGRKLLSFAAKLAGRSPRV